MCTGILLKSKNNDIVRSRTLEWSAFDTEPTLGLYPRGYAFKSQKHENHTTDSWNGKYGFLGITALRRDDLCIDGMNEKGLSAGLFYHPGTAEYDSIDSCMTKERKVSVSQIITFILSNCADVADVKSLMSKVGVVPVSEEIFHSPIPSHYIINDKNGKCVVIEFIDGEIVITDNKLGVITNSPSFDWHVTNLRNYLNISSKPASTIKINEMEIAPLSAGTGFLGLPGDFTSPSRFVRAVTFSSTARATENASDTIQESFRILDNFNVGLGNAEGSDISSNVASLISATNWTIAADVTNLAFYYHTQYNRRTRMVDLSKVDFNSLSEFKQKDMDEGRSDDIQEINI